jgi:hypothetical protein
MTKKNDENINKYISHSQQIREMMHQDQVQATQSTVQG